MSESGIARITAMAERGEPSAETSASRRFSFLDADFSKVRLPPQPVNVFDLSGFPRWETVASNVLAYFLDPRDERHGLGTLFIDALLETLNGTPPLRSGGRANAESFNATMHLGSREWVVQTEHSTDDRKRIDIYLTNTALDLAIILENKLDASVYNPLESYARRAITEFATVLTAVIAPRPIRLERVGASAMQWTSAAITYDELFDRVLPSIAGGSRGDARSVDLLLQFIENTSERSNQVDASSENEVLERFWDALRGRESGYRSFFDALSEVNAILTRRSQTLHDAIRPALDERRLVTNSYVGAGYHKRWGLDDGRLAVVYVGFALVNGITVELIVGFIPSREQYGLHVKAYGRGRGSADPYPGYDWIPVGATLADTDMDIADAFVGIVDRLLHDFPVTTAE